MVTSADDVPGHSFLYLAPGLPESGLCPLPHSELQRGIYSWFWPSVYEKVLTVSMEWSARLDLSAEFKRVGGDGDRQKLGSQS